MVPADVASAVCVRWPDRGPAWCKSVAAELAELSNRYRVRPLQVMKARYGLVVSVKTVDGRTLVLKSTPDPAGALQAVAAQQLAELRVGPIVHEVVESTTGTWTVMDLVLPGTPGIRSSLVALAALLRPFADAPTALSFPSISKWLRGRLLDGAESDLPPGVAAASAQERAHALSILDDLAADESKSMCHGDLSSGNVLRGPSNLLLVDPRAVSGDIEYDAAVLALKAGHNTRQLASILGVAPDRAEAWVTVAITARV